MLKNIILTILVIFFFIQSSQPYKFQNGLHLNITSYYNSQDKHIYINMQSYAQSQIQNSQEKDFFYLYSPQITENQYPILIKHDHSYLEIQPPMPNSKIISNRKKQNKYVLQISQPFSQFHKGIPSNKNTHFLAIQILSHQQQQDFLLPILSQQMPFVPAHSMFYCHNMIIAIDISESVQDISVFSENSSFQLKGIWEWKLNKYYIKFENLYYNRAVRNVVNQTIRISFSKNNQCQINSQLFKTNKLNTNYFMQQQHEQKLINYEVLRKSVIQIKSAKQSQYEDKKQQYIAQDYDL